MEGGDKAVDLFTKSLLNGDGARIHSIGLTKCPGRQYHVVRYIVPINSYLDDIASCGARVGSYLGKDQELVFGWMKCRSRNSPDGHGILEGMGFLLKNLELPGDLL
ncbi:hypothetical protein ES703_125821 [subsurface metagenome]